MTQSQRHCTQSSWWRTLLSPSLAKKSPAKKSPARHHLEGTDFTERFIFVERVNFVEGILILERKTRNALLFFNKLEAKLLAGTRLGRQK